MLSCYFIFRVETVATCSAAVNPSSGVWGGGLDQSNPSSLSSITGCRETNTRLSLPAPLYRVLKCVNVLVAQWCPTLCNPMDYSLLGSSVHRILQERILEWVAIPSLGDLSNPGMEPTCLMFPALAGRFLTTSATWEACYL